MLQSTRRVSPEKKAILMIVLSVFTLDKVGILFPGFWNTVGLIMILSVSFSLVICLVAILIYVIIEKEKKTNLRIFMIVVFITFILVGWFILFSSVEYQVSVLIGSFLGFAWIINAIPHKVRKKE